jgi:hypothetical protein
MVKSLDGATLGAIADRSRIVVRNFVLFTVKDSEGAPQLFGFTDYGEDVSIDIVDGVTGATVNRSYAGDFAPLVALDPIPMKIGLEVDTTQVLLNPLHPAVLLMHRGHGCRNAPVQIHRAYLSAVSMLPVALPRCRRLGFINAAPEEIAGPDGASQLKVGVVSVTRELTRTNPAKRSDETQRLRSGDRFRRYSGTAYQWPIWWGEAKAKPAGSKSGH